MRSRKFVAVELAALCSPQMLRLTPHGRVLTQGRECGGTLFTDP